MWAMSILCSAMADIDGGLIGGAALDADSFKQLIEAAAKASEE